MIDKISKTTLAIDTALNGVSVGMIAANGHIVSRQEQTQRGQAAMLVPMIQEVIAVAELSFKDIDLIACTIGPGSFTGLRIGLSTARTLGLALDIPVVGLNTLDVMAKHYSTPYPQAGVLGEMDKPLLVVLETKRQDFYARYYAHDGTPLSEPMAADASTVLQYAPKGSFVVGGDCVERFNASVSGDFERLEPIMQLDPILIAQMGQEQFDAVGDKGAPQPLYLRGADVSVSNKPQRVLADG